MPEPPWDVLALLAVTAAIFVTLGKARRQIALATLERVAVDWERATEIPGGKVAAERFIRPLLALLRASFGAG